MLVFAGYATENHPFHIYDPKFLTQQKTESESQLSKMFHMGFSAFGRQIES